MQTKLSMCQADIKNEDRVREEVGHRNDPHFHFNIGIIENFLVWDMMTPPHLPPLGVPNVKIRKILKKIKGTPGVPKEPSTTLFRPLKGQNIVKFA